MNMNNINNTNNLQCSFQYYININAPNISSFFVSYDNKKMISPIKDDAFELKFRKIEFDLFLSKIRFGFVLSEKFPISVEFNLREIVKSVIDEFTFSLFKCGDYIILPSNVCSCDFRNTFYCHFKFGQFFCMSYNGIYQKNGTTLGSPRFVFVFSDNWSEVQNIGCFEESNTQSKEDYISLLNRLNDNCNDAPIGRKKGCNVNQSYGKFFDSVRKIIKADDEKVLKNAVVNNSVKCKNASTTKCLKCNKLKSD